MRVALLGLSTLLVTACGSDAGGDSGDAPCDEGPAKVTAGVGEFDFDLPTSGGSVNMVHGPQGGWHLDTAALISGTGDVVQIVPTLVLTSDGTSIAGLEQIPETVALGSYDAEACEGKIVSIRAYLDDVQQPAPYSDFICSLDGKEVELTLTVTDVVTGDSGSGSTTFILKTDPADATLCGL